MYRTGSKTMPKKKKCKKAKWLSEEALQIAVKRREAKSKGEKEGYIYLKADSLYTLQPKMENLYTGSKNGTRS